MVGIILATLGADGDLIAAGGAKPSTPDGHITVDLHGGTMMDFVWIKPGSFLMGSTSSEPNRGEWEDPQHEVTISKGFYLGKFEITQAQWIAVMGTAPWTGKKHVEKKPNHPAVYISWTAMEEFLRRLNEVAAESLYRLPTPSGSTPVGPEARRGALTGMTTVHWAIMPGMLGILIKRDCRLHSRWAPSCRTLGVYTICTAMCGSGYRTGTETPTRVS